MFHHIVRHLIELGIAVVVAKKANDMVKDKTGKNIHDHVFEWWCQIRDELQQWAMNHRNLQIRRLVLYVLDKCDNYVVRTKNIANQVTVQAWATDQNGTQYAVTSQRELTQAELFRQFPHLANQAAVDLSLQMIN
jgi:hypothetical protein